MRRFFFQAGKAPLQHNDMDMRVEIQAGAETLHERDNASLAPHTA